MKHVGLCVIGISITFRFFLNYRIKEISILYEKLFGLVVTNLHHLAYSAFSHQSLWWPWKECFCKSMTSKESGKYHVLMQQSGYPHSWELWSLILTTDFWLVLWCPCWSFLAAHKSQELPALDTYQILICTWMCLSIML